MAYKVDIKTAAFEVTKKDIEFPVYKKNHGKLGTLKVSRGTVEWLAADHTYGYHLNWDDFGDAMMSRGTKR